MTFPISKVPGATLTSGLSSWQILQQDKNGVAEAIIEGRWFTDPKPVKARVLVRVLDESEYLPVSRALDWQEATTNKNGTWKLTLRGIPCGGLYRLETALLLDDGPIEWALRGDMVHHWGVGDIWVITGQSNAAGYGKSPVDDAPELGIHMFHASGEWRLATHPLGDSTNTKFPLNRETANASHSPFLAFGRHLRKTLGYPIGLIPSALGGSAMSQWTPPEGGLYLNLLEYLRAAGGKCRGLLWYQGESDTAPENRVRYAAAFRAMLTALRKELRSPRLPVLTAQLNRYVGEKGESPIHGYWEEMREVQRQIARKVPGVFIIPTSDLSLSDGIHNNSSANLVLGLRWAQTALGAVYGRSVKFYAPDFVTATRRSETELVLEFANVDERLDFGVATPAQWPFAVRDAVGELNLLECSLHSKNSVYLKLARPLHVKAIVVGGPTACPPMMFPFDVAGYWPMLAFRVAV